MRKLILTITTAIFLFTGAAYANAASSCEPYGGECPTSSQIVVDKLIRDPRSKGEVYVDNLTLSDYKFSPGEDVIFKIVAKNTGNTTVTNVKGTDTIPLFADYVLLSGGTRSAVREITNNFGTLSPDEIKEWFIRVRVKESSSISAGITCGDPNAINRVRIESDNTGASYDTSSFCVYKKVLGAGMPVQPEAGNELLLIASGLMGLVGVGLVGKRVLA